MIVPVCVTRGLWLTLVYRVASNAHVNRMGAVNLAIVFGMGLAPELTTGFGVSPDLGIYQTMVKLWITHAQAIFPEVEDDENSEQGSVSVLRPESADVPPSEESATLVGTDSPVSGVEQVSHEGEEEEQEEEHADSGTKQRLELVAC